MKVWKATECLGNDWGIGCGVRSLRVTWGQIVQGFEHQAKE